MTDSVILMLIL